MCGLIYPNVKFTEDRWSLHTLRRAAVEGPEFPAAHAGGRGYGWFAALCVAGSRVYFAPAFCTGVLLFQGPTRRFCSSLLVVTVFG